jgi:transglutaminase-like putative cysteine protease
MRVSVFAVVLTLLLLPSLFAGDDFKNATPEELAMKSVAIAPGAPAVVLDWTQSSDDQNSERTVYKRIKILTEEGKKYANVSILFIPMLQDLGRIRARLTRPDGAVVPFNGKTFDKVIVKAGGARLVARTFAFPDVQTGSIIEYRYTMSFGGMIIYDTQFIVQDELPILHETLWLRPYRRFAAFFNYKGLPAGKKPQKVNDRWGQEHYELELTDIPPFEEEPWSPPADYLKPQVNFYYTAQSIEPGEFWSGEAKSWGDIIEPFLADRPEVRRIAEETIAGATTDDEKLRRLYARVQRVRNLSYEPDKSEAEEKKLHDNRNPEDVLRNGYGSHLEINRTFVALARASGFAANVVRVGERDERFFSVNLTVGSQLSGEVATVMLGSDRRYFDPGTPYAPFGILAWQKMKVSGLLIPKKDEKALWVTTSDEPAESALTRRTADLRMENGSVRGTVTVVYRGQAALAKRFALRNDDDEASRKSLEAAIKEWFADGAVKVKAVKNLRDAEPPLMVEAEVELPALGATAGARALLPLSVFAVSEKNEFASERRKHPIYFRHPSTTEDVVTLHLPPGYRIEAVPKAASLDLGGLRYQRTLQSSDDSIRLDRTVTIGFSYADPTQYAGIHKFFTQLAAADQEQVVLRAQTR